jgi:hypothetical protein
MDAAYSLTPRLLLVGICSLLALLVLVFLLGMEVGRLSVLPAAPPPAAAASGRTPGLFGAAGACPLRQELLGACFCRPLPALARGGLDV